jgi:anti-sigma factor RsiW
MRQCWSEGALRAYLDRELPPEEMERVAAHLGECSRCEARRAELASRAAGVSGFVNVLPEPGRVTSLPLIRRQLRTAWQWAAAAAVAAALAIAFLLAKPAAPVAPAILSPVSSFAQTPTPPPANAVSPSQSTAPRHSKRKPERARAVADYYLALDDEPIETGVVVRVAVGPTEIPADVIFDQGGRARAIRLIE